MHSINICNQKNASAQEYPVLSVDKIRFSTFQEIPLQKLFISYISITISQQTTFHRNNTAWTQANRAIRTFSIFFLCNFRRLILQVQDSQIQTKRRLSVVLILGTTTSYFTYGYWITGCAYISRKKLSVSAFSVGNNPKRLCYHLRSLCVSLSQWCKLFRYILWSVHF